MSNARRRSAGVGRGPSTGLRAAGSLAPIDQPGGAARSRRRHRPAVMGDFAPMVTYVEIETDDWRFQPRVAAVCVWRDHVLLQAALDGHFWVLPGGRILPLEPTAVALAR